MENKPAGSLEPVHAGKGKWWEGIDAADMGQLTALARDINKAVDNTVKQVARGKIRVGKLLLEARELFIEDQAFGKWRKEHTVVQSKQHAHYLMQVAKRFGDAPKLIEGANYSVLQELVLADQEDIDWVESKIDAGEPLPTVVEVREKVKQTHAEKGAPKGTSKKALKLGSSMKTIPIHSPNTSVNMLVQLGLTLRIKEVVERGIKGIEGDYIILGMDPDPQTPCHPQVLEAAKDCWIESANDGDELRAVKDSYERVVEEFRNWNQ